MTTVLGISPGTRVTGLVIMGDEGLIDWKVKCFKGHWSDSKLKDIVHILRTYIEEYEINSVILKKPDVFRSSGGLEQLIAELRACCNRLGIQLSMVSLRTMKSWYGSSRGYSKSNMIRDVLTKYPELFTSYNKEQRSRNHYYTKMFEALILAGHGQVAIK